MENVPPVSIALTKLSIPHRVFVHAGPVRSLEQAASERGQQPSQVVRTILFRLGEGEYALVLVAGPQQISWKALRQHFGRSRLTMAGKEEVQTVTGYPIGAVAPFGIQTEVPVLVDQSVLTQDEVSMGSGVRGTGIILPRADLMRGLGEVEIGDFCSSSL